MRHFSIELRGVTCKLQYRLDCGFVIFINSTDKKLTAFADSLESKATVKSCYCIKRYENGSAAISGEFITGYDWKQVIIDVVNSFIKIYG